MTVVIIGVCVLAMLFIMAAAGIMITYELSIAPTVPRSWNEDTGEYQRCLNCECGPDGDPLDPGCRSCPFYYEPGREGAEA